MLRDITLGQYYQVNSRLHRLDPRVKLFATFIYIISLFLFKNMTAYFIAGLWLFLVIKMSKVPFQFMVKGLKPVMMILLLTVICNMLFTKGTPIVSIWKITITYEGLKMALFMTIRFVMLIVGSTIMTLTTTPNQLTDGLESILSPLKKLNVPVHEVAMMMSIALRFIPILMEETDKIMKAQIARGADFESGNLFKRVKAMLPILIPLFVSAFRRANDLAMAMEARCYRGGDGRTKMKPLIYKIEDKKALICVVFYLLILVAGGIVGNYLPI